MNIVSNTCLGGFYYRYLGTPFGNPVIWTGVHMVEFVDQVVENWEQIDWLDLCESELTKTRFGVYPAFEVGGRFELNFIHYTQDLSIPDGQVVKKYVDYIHSRDCAKYAATQYLKRVHRMLELHEKPIFVMHYNHTDEIGFMNLEAADRFISMENCTYDRYLVMNNGREQYDYIVNRHPESADRIYYYAPHAKDQRQIVPHAEAKFNLKRFLSDSEYHRPVIKLDESSIG